MKQIINNLLYDTEKAEKIVLTKEGIAYYKTANGRFFSIRVCPIPSIVLESEDSIKLALARYPDEYQRLFGEVEEA